MLEDSRKPPPIVWQALNTLVWPCVISEPASREKITVSELSLLLRLQLCFCRERSLKLLLPRSNCYHIGLEISTPSQLFCLADILNWFANFSVKEASKCEVKTDLLIFPLSKTDFVCTYALQPHVAHRVQESNYRKILPLLQEPRTLL